MWIYGIEKCEQGDIMERKKLREAREGQGMSQEELAEAVGVTPQTISDWEQGYTTPYLRNRHKLCEIFGVEHPRDLNLGRDQRAQSDQTTGAKSSASSERNHVQAPKRQA